MEVVQLKFISHIVIAPIGWDTKMAYCVPAAKILVTAAIQASIHTSPKQIK